MSLTTVIAALNLSLQPDGTIDLYAASANPDLAPLRPMLARFTIASSFVLHSARLVPGSTSAKLTGSGSWGLPGAPPENVVSIAATLDCVQLDALNVGFTLTFAVAQSNWTFGTTFAGLPDTQVSDGQIQSTAPSFMNDIRLDKAAFSATSDTIEGLTLAGSLPLSPFWQQWQALVGPWPLQLRGALTAPSAYDGIPVMDLSATAAGSSIPLQNPLLDLGALSLGDVGFAFVSDVGPDESDPTDGAFTSLNLTGRIQVGGLVARLSCPILSTGRIWHFMVEFENGDIVEGMSQLGKLFGLPSLPTPPSFLPIPAFRFSSIEFYVKPGNSLTDFTVPYINVTIQSTQPWTSPAPFITVEDVGINWIWGQTPIAGTQTGYLAARIFGTLAFGTENAFHIDCGVDIPAWAATANLRAGDVIPITEAFRNYFGSPGPPTPSDMNVVGLAIDADPQQQSYYATADIYFGTPPSPTRLIGDDDEPDDPPEQGWPIDLGVTTITLRELTFEVSVVGGEVTGGIGAVFLFPAGSLTATPPAFMLSAQYPSQSGSNPAGWVFSGNLLPGASLSLTALVQEFLGQPTVPSWVPDLSVDRLYFQFNTGSPQYAFGGTISARWTPQIFGTTLKVSAAASLDMVKLASDANASGKLEGLFSINQLSLTAGLTLGVPEPTYQFRVQFDEVWFQAFTSWRGEGEGRHQVISLQLGGVTVGQVLEYLVNLAAPTLGYSLDPPWNILNSIELSRFTLTLDPGGVPGQTDSMIDLVYAADADLVFMKLDTIGIRYTRGAKSGVSLILTGSLLGKHYGGDDLSWDVIDESPPALPGQGESFIRLRYLGLGQRVQLTRLPDTVAETLALLTTELKAPEPGQNPMTGQGVVWSPVSQWLIGMDVTLLDTVDIGFVFNDPWLYGLSIALGGEQAGSLSGLRFEILYKKISDSVGMFRIELMLPEAYRTFEFGEVSVTLGVVVIEIYTNGNFKIDLGFPYNRDFERSFTVQVFPFIGRGGIYFGLLDGTTSRRVPRITNGNFAPVIELGVGLAVGVGKDIHVGPLSGGIYVEVEVLFQGVLGWFHPSAAGGETATYYWAQGVAAIHGKLYGAVDFKVIKVSVTLDAYAAATVTLEAYRPTEFLLEVSVTAQAEVKILFVRIKFGFHVELDVSFQIGQDRPTPWILASDQSTQTFPPHAAAASRSLNRPSGTSRGATRRRMSGPRRRPARRRQVLLQSHLTKLAARMGGASRDDPAVALNWQPDKAVFSDSPRTAGVYFLPAFTVGDVALNWSATAPVNPSPQYRFAMQLFAPTGSDVEAMTVAAAKVRSAALAAHARTTDDLDTLAATTLIEALLLYAVYAIPGGPQSAGDNVTAGQLALLAGRLDDPLATAPGFTRDALSQFFGANVHLSISGIPDGDGTPAAVQSGMAVAVPPFMRWTSPQTGPVDFAADNQIGPLYIWGVQAATALFSPSGQAPPGPPADPLSDYQSFASHLFADWCLLIAKCGVRDALAALDNRTLPAATSEQTLTSLASALPTATVAYPVRPGDTVESVADALGATVDELNFLNPDLASELLTAAPGSSVTVVLGVSPEVLASDNPGAALQVKGLSLGDLTIPVVATDTLDALGERYLTTAQAILAVPGQDVDAKLLAAGALFDAPATVWTAAPADFTALMAAAVFYVRYTGGVVPLDSGGAASGWYAQALAQLNVTVLQGIVADTLSAELPPGTVLDIPTAYLNATPIADAYTTVPGDTLTRIGAALNLDQNYASDEGDSGWPAFRDGVSAVTGGYSIPAYAGVAILPAETTAMLARRTVVNWVSNGAVPPVWSASWSGLAAWVGGATILAPLTLITIPDVTTDDTTDYTFASLAAAYGLSLTAVGARLADVTGLVAGESLTVKHLPADTIQSLTDRIAADAIAGIAGEASRFLFSGQEIPVPVAVAGEEGHVKASDTAVSPLFDQSRQQWTIAVDVADPTGVALSLELSTQVDWIALFDSTVVAQGEDLAALRARVPGAFAAGVNRALEVGRVPPAGMILNTRDVETLSYSITNAEVLAEVPVTGLAWPPYEAPAAVDIRGEAPVTYELPQQIALQTAVPLPVPGFDVTKNTLSIHPFAPALLARAAAGTNIAYGLYESVSGTADAAMVENATFACLIAFTVRRIAEAPGVYQLVGAQTEQVGQLLALIDYLADPLTPSGSIARVALPPSTGAADPSGLALVDGDAWLIKSNLSTETVPPGAAPLAAGDPAPLLCRAGLADPKDFALLLWEGTSVGGFGYSFGVDGGIGDGSFDAGDQAVLQLLVIFGAQQEAAPDGRLLVAADNVALAVDQGIADGATLFVEAVDTDDPVEFVVQALVPAGSAGFDLALTRPVVAEGDGGMNALRQNYSLITVSAAATTDAPYAIPASGLPAPPQAWDGETAPVWKQARAKRSRAAGDDPEPDPYWAYQTVLPIYRFGPASAAPDVSGLPLPASDPYRGLGTASQAPQVAFSIGVGDVLGNRNAPTDNTPLAVTVGYTDPLNGPPSWPSVNAYYLVSKTGDAVELGITLAAKAQALMPATDQRGDALYEAASRQAALYASIYYQYAQPGLAATAETTLQSGASLDLLGAGALPGFAAGGYLTATGAMLYGAVTPEPAALGTIVGDYGVGWQALATVNAQVPLSGIFGADVALTVPAYVVMASGDTANGIAVAPRSGWPAPTAGQILGFTQNADDLPLRSGAVLNYSPRAFTLADPAPTLADAATAQSTSAAWLANDSGADPMLADGFAFVIDDVVVTVGVTAVPGGVGTVATFADAVLAFVDAGIGVSAYTLGDLYAAVPGVLIAGAQAHTAHYIVTGEASLSSNPSGATTDDLIANNVATPDLFDTGALIYLGDFGAGAPPTVTPMQDETVSGFAGRYGCPPAALLGANAALAVIAGTALAIPGAARLPDSQSISVPYTLRSGDILSTVAAGFDLTPAPDKQTALADRNADMPGTVAQGLTYVIDVQGTPVTIDTTGLTSFDEVLTAVQATVPTATMADIAPAFDVAGRLAAGGLLVCPPAILATATKPSDVRTPYGIGATAFALANSGVLGLVLPNVELDAPDPAVGTVTTAVNDTLNSVVGRFNDLYLRAGKAATATVANVVDRNRDLVLFAAQARALLPPADITLTTPLASSGPYPSCAFALTVDLIVKRPQDLVLDGFKDTNAETARATIAAPAGSISIDGGLTFDDFAAALLNALPNLRLATAKTPDQAADLWAANFDANGIASVQVGPSVLFDGAEQARMIALAPLYGVLVSRAQVPIEPLVNGSLDPAQVVLHDYQGIDVEVWASRFISEFERLLEPAPAAAIDAIAALRPQFVRMMTAKQTLQSAIPSDLKGVFRTKETAGGSDARAVYDPNLTAGLAEARGVLGQALGVSLASAWATAAIFQYDGAVDSCWTRAVNPPSGAALYGQARSADDIGGDDPANPSWRLAAAKVSLSQEAPFLTLPLGVSTPGAQSALTLDLAYAVTNIEINRVPEPAAPGYTRSDWLAMTPVLDAAADTMPAALQFELGLTTVPIPLKAFPALPLILSQTGTGDVSAPPTLETAALWTFDFVYSHEHAAQDHVLVTVEANLSPSPPARLADTPPQDLFTSLAQYVAVADDLNGLLAGLSDASRGVPEPTLEAAVTTFADLATAIADLWTVRLPNQALDTGEGDDWVSSEVYPFSAVVNYGGSWVVESYTLTRLDGGIGSALDWPEVACQSPDGDWVTLTPAAPVGDTRTYTPPEGVTLVGPWPRLSLSWPGLNVATTQNARVELEVLRNTDLLGDSGPATADAFVYRTATVTATDIVTPAISRTDPYAMTGATMEAALQAAFDALFPPAERPADLHLTLGLFYGYTLVPGPQALVSELAVGLIPDQILDGTTAGLVAGALDRWQQQVKPNTDEGSWVVSLMLYSSFDPGKRVLLSLDRLSYPLSQSEVSLRSS